MLPLVSRIVQDIMAYYGQWQERMSEFELLLAKSRADAPEPKALELEQGITTLAAEIDRCQSELRALEVDGRDAQLGIVDFPGRMGDRRILLSWRLGEPAVEHWRDAGAAFPDRQRLGPHAVI